MCTSLPLDKRSDLLRLLHHFQGTEQFQDHNLCTW